MSLYIEEYKKSLQREWDEFVVCSHNGTFLHTRRFLSYHGDRFHDESILIKDTHKGLVGVFPAAKVPLVRNAISSHPGITYGGIVHTGKLRGENMIEALKIVANYYTERKNKVLYYKTIPNIYQRIPSNDDSYALFRLNGQRYRCDLSAVVDLSFRLPLTDRRERGLKKARRTGIVVVSEFEYVSEFWKVLEHNLKKKYNAQPVHSLIELKQLQQLFPQNIMCVTALLSGRVIAGVLMFIMPTVIHVQYMASDDEGRKFSALDTIFQYCFQLASQIGIRYFDFGTSNQNDGKILNQGLYQFKTEYGAGGVVYEHYQLKLPI